jgi:pimeloyl-ACP methyl ester carboxylesterase
MSIVKTKSFELAIYLKGNPESPKLALVLPGKLDTKDYSHIHSHVEYLANRGYFALSFDPPGTWESSGDIKLYTMTNYLKAVDEIIEYYGNRSTFVMGHSRGATIATIAGARSRHVFAFAAVMSSFSKGGFQEKPDKNWKIKGFAISKRDLPPGGGEKVKEFRLPYSFFEDQTKYDLTEDITSSTKPKLFILGKHDDLIPPKTIKETFSQFAEPKELYEINSDHDYRHHLHLINEVNKTIGEFLEKYSS